MLVAMRWFLGDRRIACVVLQVPTISGYQQGLRRIAPEGVAALEAALNDDERAQRGVNPRGARRSSVRTPLSQPRIGQRTPSTSTSNRSVRRRNGRIR